MGIAVQPSFLVGDDLREGQIQRLLPDFAVPEFGVCAVYPSHRHLSAKVRTFVELLAEGFGEPPPWDDWMRGGAVNPVLPGRRGPVKTAPQL